MKRLVILALVAAWQTAILPAQAPTLRSMLQGTGIPLPPSARDLDAPLTSGNALDDDQAFVIAYYHVTGDELHELFVRRYDKRTRTWRSAVFPDGIGSVFAIRRIGSLLYLSGHSTPSLGPLLVLTEDLRRRAQLNAVGPLTELPSGLVVFMRGMVHFAPAHAEALAVYDPAANREYQLYPPPPAKYDRGIEYAPGSDGVLIERGISDVRPGSSPGTVQFIAIEERKRLQRDQTTNDEAPSVRHLVTCTDRRPVSCRSQVVNEPPAGKR